MLRLALTLWLVLICSPALAIGTTFTYQGSLEDNNLPANGFYDFSFRLMTSANAAVTSAIVVDNVEVVKGVFTVNLNFGVSSFNGNDRFLEISVRPGTSTGAYTVLLPNTPIHPSPYAQRASFADEAYSASIADDVIDDAIDSVDIAPGAVANSDLATSSVDNDNLINGAVTQTRMAGALGTYGIAVSAGVNDCSTYSVSFGGDVNVNDIPLLVLDSGSSLPANTTLHAIRVTADNQVEIRFCNHGTTAASSGSINVRLVTFR